MLFEGVAYTTATFVFLLLRRRFGDSLPSTSRWIVVTTAVSCAALGSKALFWFEDPTLTLQNLHDPAYMMGGKTIVGALVLGLAGVELMKRYIGLGQSTGDLFAIPLALGIAIGRIGCFLTGLSDNTNGVATSLPWGVDFGDGLRRHPTQLYETAFLLLLTPILYRIMKSIRRLDGASWPQAQCRPGDAFRFFMVMYLSFRLVCDFLKPYPRVFLQLNTLQWVCLLCLLYYSRDLWRWLNPVFKRTHGAEGAS